MVFNQKTVSLIFAFIIVCLGILNYVNSLEGEFIWDDNFLIKDNPYLKNRFDFANFFFQDIGKGSDNLYNFYRPLLMISYKLDYSLWRQNSFGYHLTNICLHILVALSIFWLIKIMFKDCLLAFIASVLFISHPVHTEAVAYISGRGELMAALFIFLSSIFYIKYITTRKNIYYLILILSCLIAFFSKENSFIIPILLLLISHFSFNKQANKKAILTVILICLLALFWRAAFIKLLPSTTLVIAIKRVPAFLSAIPNYLRLLLLPFNLHLDYGQPTLAWLNPRVILGIITISLLLFIIFKTRKKNRIICFSLSWFLLSLSPYNNIYPPLMFYMADHHLYLPSLGFFLILAYGLVSLYREKSVRAVFWLLFLCLLFLYSFLTIKQNKYWLKPIPFYQRTIKFAPQSTRVYLNLGNEYAQIGKYDRAISCFKKVIDLEPNSAKAYLNLGIVYLELRKFKMSKSALETALKLDPNQSKTYYNLGILYRKYQEIDKAAEFFKRAVQIYPEFKQAYNNLGSLFLSQGKIEEGITYFKKALNIDPAFEKALNNLAIAYAQKANYKQAIRFLNKLIKINPEYAAAYYNLSKCYYFLGDFNKADELLSRAKQLGFIGSEYEPE